MSEPEAKSSPKTNNVADNVWWSKRGLVHFELLPKGQTVNADVYCAQLKRAGKELEKKQAALVNRKGVLYLHDNARPHVAKQTQQTLHQLQWEVLPHAPYSPDMAPSDYYLFRALDSFLVNQRMNNEEEIKSELESFFASRDQQLWITGISSLEQRWQKIVVSGGEFIID
jgi:histone-lysine N-methyltransferase SETMAR